LPLPPFAIDPPLTFTSPVTCRPPALAPLPEAHVLAGELGEQLRAAMDRLPPAQRVVLDLRDVQGFSSSEVCELLAVTEANQRVLLHRARSRMRAVLEDHL